METKNVGWLELADLNLAAVIKSRMNSIPNATLLEQHGQLAYSIGMPILDGHLNGILRYSQDNNTQNIREFCNDFLQRLGHGFVIWIRDHADSKLETSLRSLGLAPMREPGSAGMITEQRLSLPETPTDFQIAKVSTNEEAEDFNRVIAASFGMPLAISQLAIGRLSQLTKPNVAAFVIKSQGQAVAAGMTVVEHGVAGLYYIGTIPQARGRGLGELCTRLLTNTAFDLGARAAILQASKIGEPLYQRVGYKTITHYRWYSVHSEIKKVG